MDDHHHRDQGHFTITRGADPLVVDSGAYGLGQTIPYHNTLGFDDGGKISTYSPHQGYWGRPGTVRIKNFEDSPVHTFAQADFGESVPPTTCSPR